MSNVNEKLVQLEIDVLNENNLTAEENRRFFKENNILALNLVSSPGSGKTTLLCRTVSELKSRFSVSVIEGDQETINDAERIRATGVDAIQINTGEGCHLDAAMIKNALTKFPDLSDSVLFIENVGNLVCPASFDLGEFCKVAVLSVTEGEDKPIKYPYMFAASKVMIINKTDLLPYVDFSVDRCIDYARRVNPSIEVFLLSATKGDGMQEWCSWIAVHTAKRD